MSIRKIGDLVEPRICRDPCHNPPTHWCPSPGVYEHVCPSCGKRQQIVIGRGSTMSASDSYESLARHHPNTGRASTGS